MTHFQKVETPQALPGCCFLTLSAQEEWFIDTGIQNDLTLGAVYIGKSAVVEMARLAGMVYPDEVNSIDPSDQTITAPVVASEASPENPEKILLDIKKNVNDILHILGRHPSNQQSLAASGTDEFPKVRRPLSAVPEPNRDTEQDDRWPDEQSNVPLLDGVRPAPKRKPTIL